MIVDKLKSVLDQYKTNANKLFIRSALKEALQDYVLNFIYNDADYKTLIFTGGTCLRKVYGLPRLSEDLDFDFIDGFEIKNFAAGIKAYFIKGLQYKDLAVKVSGAGQSVFLKFPIFKDLGLVKNPSDSPFLFVRCDFSRETIGVFKTEVNSISTTEFSFFSLSYDLPTLFSNKIMAFLKRDFFKGKKQALPFKGRDLFDLVWFLEKSKKSDLKPNWERLIKGLTVKSKQEVVERILDKTERIEKKDVYTDLSPFIENGQVLDNFVSNFGRIIKDNAKYF